MKRPRDASASRGHFTSHDSLSDATTPTRTLSVRSVGLPFNPFGNDSMLALRRERASLRDRYRLKDYCSPSGVILIPPFGPSSSKIVLIHSSLTRIGLLSASTCCVPFAVTRMTQSPGVLSMNGDDD